MKPEDSTAPSAEQLAIEEIGHRRLFFRDKQLLREKNYSQLVLRFRRRSTMTAVIFGAWLLMASLRAFGLAPSLEVGRLGAVIAFGIMALMFTLSLRGWRRCTRTLHDLESTYRA